MNRKLLILSAIPIVLIVLMIIFNSLDMTSKDDKEETTPSSPLIPLSQFKVLSDTFNADSGCVRVLGLLSPTDPVSNRGYRTLKYVLHEITDPELHLYIIWIPVLQTDRKEFAIRKAEEWKDERVKHFWDSERMTTLAWQEILGLDQLAWNVHLIYADSVTWGFEPSPPTFWMRQLGGGVDAPILNKELLVKKIRKMLSKDSLSTPVTDTLKAAF